MGKDQIPQGASFSFDNLPQVLVEHFSSEIRQGNGGIDFGLRTAKYQIDPYRPAFYRGDYDRKSIGKFVSRFLERFEAEDFRVESQGAICPFRSCNHRLNDYIAPEDE